MPLPCYIKNESEWNFNRVSMVIQDSPAEKDRKSYSVATKKSDSSLPNNVVNSQKNVTNKNIENYKNAETVSKKSTQAPPKQSQPIPKITSPINIQDCRTIPIVNESVSLTENDMLFVVKHLQSAIVNVLLRKANIQFQKKGSVWSYWEIENQNEGSTITIECRPSPVSEITPYSTSNSNCLKIKQEDAPEMLQILSDPYSLQECSGFIKEEEKTNLTQQNDTASIQWESREYSQFSQDADNMQNKEDIGDIEDCDSREEYSEDEDDDDDIKVEYVKKNDVQESQILKNQVNNQRTNNEETSKKSSKSEIEIFNCYNKYCSSSEKKNTDSNFQFCPLPEFTLPQISLNNAEKEFSCKFCSKTFRQSNNLISHERTHTGEKPFECLECGKHFAQLSNLTTHKRTHTGEKPYPCQGCDKNFTTWGSRYLHERTHTGYRPHVCKSCGKTFTQKRNLVTHERTHSGERPYPCSFCSKRFSTVSIAKAHERIHTGEKPYCCRHCDKKFSHLTNLNTHERLHTGVKPYACTLCGKRFAAYSSAKSHARVHSAEKS